MVTIKVDTREFDKVFSEYMKYTSRDLVEACNQHAYYIARDAVADTKSVSKEKITGEMGRMSKEYPPAPLGAIIVQKKRAEKGLKGLSGRKMAIAVERLIRARNASRNFVKAGWIPAIKLLAAVVPKKGGKSIAGTKKRGVDKGGAKPAIPSIFNWSPMTSIWNSVSKLRDQGFKIMEDGAQRAVAEETQSMRDYIERKLVERGKKVGG